MAPAAAWAELEASCFNLNTVMIPRRLNYRQMVPSGKSNNP
jgi:hypothetical protein